MDQRIFEDQPTGTEVYRYLGVPVFSNGVDKDRSHGQHFNSENDYYYGQKWQCVEFVKRFYEQVLHYRMPHVWGHAKDYFDDRVGHGELNTRRGLLQFRNRGDDYPGVHDILVFSDTQYGHVAIVTRVSSHCVEVVQQNIAGNPVESFGLTQANGTFFVHTPRTPLGWLRMKKPEK
ncbi:MAG: CHAP domain-containing protein [Methylococcales bacterium]